MLRLFRGRRFRRPISRGLAPSIHFLSLLCLVAALPVHADPEWADLRVFETTYHVQPSVVSWTDADGRRHSLSREEIVSRFMDGTRAQSEKFQSDDGDVIDVSCPVRFEAREVRMLEGDSENPYCKRNRDGSWPGGCKPGVWPGVYVVDRFPGPAAGVGGIWKVMVVAGQGMQTLSIPTVVHEFGH